MSKHYFGADLFSRTQLLSEIYVQIFAHFEFLRENARKLVRAKISTNKVYLLGYDMKIKTIFVSIYVPGSFQNLKFLP